MSHHLDYEGVMANTLVDPTKPKITILHANLAAVYTDNDLLMEHNQLTTEYILRGLGYDVETMRVEYSDMPKTTPHYNAPKSLSSLKEHLKKIESQKRQIQIQRLKESLARLEKEEADG